ncbi:hypothetical protein [Mycolicibacterium tusciae]|nr:hypothetical protein [Mycolicibacterium tusciae]
MMQGMAAQARDGATRDELRATAALAAIAWPWTPGQPNKRPRRRD